MNGSLHSWVAISHFHFLIEGNDYYVFLIFSEPRCFADCSGVIVTVSNYSITQLEKPKSLIKNTHCKGLSCTLDCEPGTHGGCIASVNGTIVTFGMEGKPITVDGKPAPFLIQTSQTLWP